MKISMASMLAGAALCLAQASHAQNPASGYPAKPVKILVGYGAGGPTDLTARVLASKLQAALGQPFIVENKPGAGSNLAAEQAAQSAPDGYTLMVAASQLTWNSVLYKNLKFDVTKSFVPISEIMSAPSVLVVNPALPVNTLADLLALARKDPGKLSYASSGNGTVPHIAGELLKSRAKIDIVHVPYRGAGPAVTDVLGGQVSMSFMTALSATQYIKGKKLKALAVTSKQRLPQLPDVPTMAEAGVPGVEIDSWNGLFAPAGTPKEIIEKLYQSVSKALAMPDVRKTFEDQSATVVGSSPADFGPFVKKEVAEGSAFVKSIKLSLE